MSPNITDQDTSNFYYQAGQGTIPNFLLAGYYDNGTSHTTGTYGAYWSSTSARSDVARLFVYRGSSYIDTASNYYRRVGFSIRCIVQ